ncbi:hypothetical protein VPH35_012695 [Triticum aestivum]
MFLWPGGRETARPFPPPTPQNPHLRPPKTTTTPICRHLPSPPLPQTAREATDQGVDSDPPLRRARARHRARREPAGHRPVRRSARNFPTLHTAGAQRSPPRPPPSCSKFPTTAHGKN